MEILPLVEAFAYGQCRAPFGYRREPGVASRLAAPCCEFLRQAMGFLDEAFRPSVTLAAGYFAVVVRLECGAGLQAGLKRQYR
ncbi:hypothetical protein D3C84_1074520 [compost metagenome]